MFWLKNKKIIFLVKSVLHAFNSHISAGTNPCINNKAMHLPLMHGFCTLNTFEPRHENLNNVVCPTSKGSDQPAHMRTLIRAFASSLNTLWLLSYWPNPFGVSKLRGGCTGSSESTFVKMPHCWKSHVTALIYSSHEKNVSHWDFLWIP